MSATTLIGSSSSGMASRFRSPLPCIRPPRLRASFAPSVAFPIPPRSRGNTRRSAEVEPLRTSMPPSPPDEGGGGGEKGGMPERVRVAFEKAAAYKKEKEEERAAATNAKEMPETVRRAMEKARRYKITAKGRGRGRGRGRGNGDTNIAEGSGPQGIQTNNSNNSRDEATEENYSVESEASVSKIDFTGLDSPDEKKKRGSPPDLAPVVDTSLREGFPEVKIIVGDPTKFGNTKSTETALSTEDNPSGLYKPKVLTWGVFPRPENISKTFGGGRNIRPGEELETAEVKAAREAHTRELIARYKKEAFLNIDPKVKSECEKALKDGDQLMDDGKLREALPYYEKIMKTLDFQSELHGLAALQWAICQDSLCRHDEAEVMYEKLESHPNVAVSKKARQFVFGFQVMQMMNISNLLDSKTTDYENYFAALLDNETGYGYGARQEELDNDSLLEIIPYILFLLSPIVLIVSLAAQKGPSFSGW